MLIRSSRMLAELLPFDNHLAHRHTYLPAHQTMIVHMPTEDSVFRLHMEMA